LKFKDKVKKEKIKTGKHHIHTKKGEKEKKRKLKAMKLIPERRMDNGKKIGKKD
jgi:coenzyme F420-reducing hydrogenase beta subunit